MKWINIFACVMMSVASACTSGNVKSDISDTENDSSRVSATPDIRGQWYIESIVFDDNNYVRPSEEVPDSHQYISFTDSTYSIITNCNALSGFYKLEGDSICLDDGAMTEIACDNMATEDALRMILPHIVAVDVENDSVMRLNSSEPFAYILLVKAEAIK